VSQNKVLIVYDRLDYFYKDPEYINYFTDALTLLGYGFDLWNTAYRGPISSGELLQYINGVVIWSMPQAGYLGYDVDQQNALQSYLDGGGNLFITGQDIGYYLTWGGSTPNTLYSDYLSAQFVQDNVGLYELTGINGDPVSGDSFVFINNGDGANNQLWPSEIIALPPAVPIFTYENTYDPTISKYSEEQELIRKNDLEPLEFNFYPQKNNLFEDIHQDVLEKSKNIIGSGTGALRFENDVYRLIYFAFGFESINGEAGHNRIEVLDDVLKWLMPNHPPEKPYDPFPTLDDNISNSSFSQINNNISFLSPEDVILWWNGEDVDPNDNLSYDVYLSLDEIIGAEDLLVVNLINSWFDPKPLMQNQNYYWQIVARDRSGEETSSPVWHFITGNWFQTNYIFLPSMMK
jgi:hypothetical protein